MHKAFGALDEHALEVCGLEIKGAGYRTVPETLFLEWAGIVRKLGKVPTITEYERFKREEPASAGEPLPFMEEGADWDPGVSEEPRAARRMDNVAAHYLQQFRRSRRRRSWTSSHAENLTLKAKIHSGQERLWTSAFYLGGDLRPDE